MADAAVDKKEEIKRLAMIEGFDEIEARFGAKARAKAEAYRAKKLGKSKGKATAQSVTPSGGSPGKAPAAAKPPRKSAPKKGLAIKKRSTPSGSAGKPKAGKAKAASSSAASTPARAAGAKKPRATKRRRPTDPTAPKQPKSAFFLFCAERRAALTSENPGSAATEVAKLLGLEWRALSSDDRKPFEEQAESARAQYRKAKAAHEAVSGAKARPAAGRRPKLAPSKPSARKASSSSSSGRTVVRRTARAIVYSDGTMEDPTTGEPLWGPGDDVVPRQVRPMDYSRFEIEAGSDVVVIMPALLAFLASFKAELEQAAADHGGPACTLDPAAAFTTDGIVFATVESMRRCAEPGAASSSSAATSAFAEAAVELTLQLSAQDGTASGDPVTIPWLPPSHPLVRDDAHVVSRAAYEDATLERELRPGMQVTRQFALSDDPSRGAVHEGRVYYVGKPPGATGDDFPDTPFQCVRLVWYEQDRATRRWFIQVDQTDNLASPWDLRPSSSFVHPDNVSAFASAVPVLGDAEQVLAYVGRTEAAAPFRDDPAKDDPSYHDFVPPGTAVSLRSMGRRCAKGEYDGAPGMQRLWEDFKLLIHNARTRHQEEYWEWRAADMLEKELRAVKRAVAPGKGSISDAKAAIPRVRPTPAGAKAGPAGPRRRRHPDDPPRRRTGGKPSVVDLTPARGGGRSRRSAAASAILAMDTAAHDNVQLADAPAAAGDVTTAEGRESPQHEAGSDPEAPAAAPSPAAPTPPPSEAAGADAEDEDEE